jgi:hypothetical protein
MFMFRLPMFQGPELPENGPLLPDHGPPFIMVENGLSPLPPHGVLQPLL